MDEQLKGTVEQLDREISRKRHQEMLERQDAAISLMASLGQSIDDLKSVIELTSERSTSAFEDEIAFLGDEIRGIKIEPTFTVPDVKVPELKVPEAVVKVEIPEIKVPEATVKVEIPEIKVPTPQVTVNVPDVIVPPFPEIPPIVMPDSMTVRGDVGLRDVDNKRPLPVIMMGADGQPAALGSGSVGSRNVFSQTMLKDDWGNPYQMLSDTLYGGAPVVIDIEHHEIHCGDSYTATKATDLVNGATEYYLVKVPTQTSAKEVYHLLPLISSEAETEYNLYEDPTTTADGVAMTFFNRNRNTNNTTGLKLFHTPTVTGVGTTLYTHHFGTGRAAGGETRSEEFVLKGGKNYLFSVTNYTVNNNFINVEVNHYIHPGI